MGDVGDTFKALKEIRKQQKQERMSDISSCYDSLEAVGLEYRINNGGFHLIIIDAGVKVADFWPSTENFLNRKTKRYGKGLSKLIDQVKRGSS